LGESYTVPSGMSTEELENERVRLERLLLDLGQRVQDS